jgi:cobalt/nickel transport system permease protein
MGVTRAVTRSHGFLQYVRTCGTVILLLLQIASKKDVLMQQDVARNGGFIDRWRRPLVVVAALGLAFFTTGQAHAMHIAEGFLPQGWSIAWYLATAPFFLWGLRRIGAQVADSPQKKLSLGMSGAFSVVLSSLKIPSVTGSSSHPTGVALGAILFGPTPMVVLGTIVLVFQAILLAHGGVTTLGANAFSMAVVGPIVAYWTYRALRPLGTGIAVFLAATISDWATYLVTALQLALAFPAEVGGYAESFAKFTGIFALTQVPLAISEGLLTLIVFNHLVQFNPELFEGGATAGARVATAGVSIGRRSIALGLGALVLAATPLLLVEGQSEWLASDGKFQTAVEELSADYVPWFDPIVDLEALGMSDYEPYLFEFQAFLGMAVISAIGGMLIGRRRALDGASADGDLRVAYSVVAVVTVAGIAMGFAQSELGEIQAFYSAIQGICFGVLPFLWGYPTGRRAVPAHAEQAEDRPR